MNPPGSKFTSKGTKKVFDIVRPGKTMAGANSRPMIMGHKPDVPDDQFVAGAPARSRATNPGEKRPLMDTATKVTLQPSAGYVPTSTAPSLPAKKPLSSQPAPPKQGTIEIVDQQQAEDISEKIKVGVSTPTAPAMPLPSADPQPDLLVDLDAADHADMQSAEDAADEAESQPSQVPLPPEPEEVEEPVVPLEVDEPPVDAKPEADPLLADPLLELEPEIEAPLPDEPDIEQPLPDSDEPDPKAPIAEALTRTDIMSGAGMTLPDHQEERRMVISHHKNRMSWWQWLLIVVLILVLGVAAFNFVLDAELIHTDLPIPYTNLL